MSLNFLELLAEHEVNSPLVMCFCLLPLPALVSGVMSTGVAILLT